MKIEDFIEIIEVNQNTKDYHNSTSLNLAIELHYEYRSKGFKPNEFYEYLTGFSAEDIENWSDAVIKLTNFIDEKDISNESH